MLDSNHPDSELDKVVLLFLETTRVKIGVFVAVFT